MGAGHGLLSTTIYTVEVVSKELRGSFSVFEGVTRSLGMILTYSLGAVLPWHLIPAVGAVFPVLASLLLLHSPESPVHLAARGRLQEAERALRRLTSSSHDVTKDLKEILEGLQKSREKATETKSKESKWTMLKNIDRHPEIYKPFLIVSFLRNVFKSIFIERLDSMALCLNNNYLTCSLFRKD